MIDFEPILLALNIAEISSLLYLVHRRPRQQVGGLLLDSCALIDGRILDMVKSGFIYSDLVIPHFVLRELQLLADGKDKHKRDRARYGLEVAEKLQIAMPTKVTVDDSLKIADKTDELLIILAKKRGARLCTTDYNLGKVASVEGVRVMNLNELSMVLKTNVLPGDEKELSIIQLGDSPSQGIGYLEDGVMVVVYGAGKLVGTKQRVIVERSLQTVSGKMCFAHLRSVDSSAHRTPVKKK